MSDGPGWSKEEHDAFLANMGRMKEEMNRLFPGPTPEQHQVNMLARALFGAVEQSFFHSVAFRFLDRGPTGKAYRLFCRAIRTNTSVEDRAAVLTVVRKDGRYLRFASPNIRDDKEVYLAAVQQYEGAASYIGKRLADDRDFLLSLQRLPPLSALSDRLRDDREIVLRSGSLSGASDRLRDDEELVRALVARNARVFSAASERLRDNKEMVLYAISQERGLDPTLLPDVSERLRTDPDVVAAAHESMRRKAEALERSGFNAAYC